MTKIDAYAVVWSLAQNRGTANLKLAGGEEVRIEVDSAQELFAIHELLRSGHQVGYDAPSNSIGTNWRPPGA